MKFRTWFTAGTAAAVGFVLGTAAGREKFEKLKSGVQQLTQNPKVQQNVSKVADTVAQKAETMNPKVGGMVKSAAQQVQSKVQTSGGPDLTPPSATFPPSPVTDLGDTYPADPMMDVDDTIPPSPTPGTGF